jgi:hypothetical protein
METRVTRFVAIPWDEFGLVCVHHDIL